MLWDKRYRFVLEWCEDEKKPSYAIVFTLNENCELTGYTKVEMPGKRKFIPQKERHLNQTINAVNRKNIIASLSSSEESDSVEHSSDESDPDVDDQ